MEVNVSSAFESGNLVFRDKANAVIATINGATRAVTLPTGAVLDYTDDTKAVGVAGGYKIARGATALDGANPTPVTTGLTTVVAATVSLRGTVLSKLLEVHLINLLNAKKRVPHQRDFAQSGDARL